MSLSFNFVKVETNLVKTHIAACYHDTHPVPNPLLLNYSSPTHHYFKRCSHQYIVLTHCSHQKRQ